MTHPFLHLPSLSWVAAGGTLGAGAREGLILAMPDAGHLPWAVVIANVVGAFALGLLYASLDRHTRARARLVGPGPKGHKLSRDRQLRLLLGTGFCGGFTTYSTLAVGVMLLGAGSLGPVLAGAAGLGVVVAGAVATWAGIAVGTNFPASPGPVADGSALPGPPPLGGQHL
ncbi:CrcB family protein [Arthrobacter sp.]|uniref:fluoride efflux transporter FluC n=1 Tax=Arthrobacter sp. TaxID=1667 RepID=UPI0026E0B4C2|nr:CrcB family protein [Arthrobacter sp.]MDO5751642.1 CrcB family protein [Arthrobacter sp.]